MTKLISLLFLFALAVHADTPPPTSVKAKTYSGDGVTPITATGTSLNVNITGGGTGGGTVDQGAAGTDPWLFALPTGASTSALQTSGAQKSQMVDASGNTYGPRTQVSGVNYFPVINLEAATDAAPVAPRSIQIGGSDGTNLRNISVDTSGRLNTNLPTGAATSALQTSGNASLTSIDSKTPALGQALAAASVPVVLTASQLSTLTPLSTVSVTQGTSPWVISGTTTVSGTVAATQSGTWTTGRTWNLSSGSDSVSSVQSGTWNLNNISGTISLPTGAATEASLAKLTLAQASTTSGQSGPLMQGAVTTASPSYTTAQTSPLSLTTAGALRVDASATTQPISAASLPLPSGASTSSLQTTGNSSLSSIDTKTPALGQALAAASTPVVLTAAQLSTLTPLSTVAVTQSTSPWVISGSTTVSGTVAATQSGTWNITNVSGTVSLPTGAATAANQLLSPKNVTGSQVTGTVSTVITLTAPANTVGYILQAADANTANMRYRVGATATTTSGMQLQPGRDTGFVPLGANISIVAESGTQEYEVQWIAQ